MVTAVDYPQPLWLIKMDIEGVFEGFKLLTPFLGPFIGGWFGAWWGMKKYKHEKSWDEKKSIYKRIIVNLASMDHLVQVDPESGGHWSPEMYDQIYDPLAELRELSAESIFFTEPSVSVMLDRLNVTITDGLIYLREMRGTDEHPEEFCLPKIREAIKDTRQKIISIGKDDLANRSPIERLIAKLKR